MLLFLSLIQDYKIAHKELLMNTLLRLLLLLVLLSPSACSFLERLNPFSADKEAGGGASLTENSSTDSELAKEKALSAEVPETGVEIFWQAPREEVISYRILFGSSPENLSRQVEVPVSALKFNEHPKQGRVYSYVLKEGTRSSVLYVSLQARNQAGYGPISKPFRVEVLSAP